MAWQQPPTQQQGQWGQPNSHNTSINVQGGPHQQQPQAPQHWGPIGSSNQQQQQQPQQQQGQWQAHQQQGQWQNQPPQQQQWGQPQQQMQMQGQYGQQQGQWGQQQGQWGQQQGMCSCCDQCCQQQGGCCQQGCCQQGCQPYPGQQVDPYCCGPPLPEQQETGFCCDITCWFVGLFFILSLIGIAVVLGVSDTDNIFKKFGASDTRDLSEAVNSMIPYQVQLAALCVTNSTPTPAPTPAPTTNGSNTTTAAPTPAPSTAAPWVQPCTPRKLFGSFGTLCLEDSLNAGTFAANLSHWNNFRGTLYFLAFVITTIFMVVVYAVHRQKYPSGGLLNQSQQTNFAPSKDIQLFGTDLYEVFRCAWFVSGFVVFFWVANAMTSYWNFIRFYKNNTVGELQDFWTQYDKKFVASVVCVTIYLAWPIFLIALEFGIWIVLVLPYYAIRMLLKPGIENVRPDVPSSELPGWVRVDIFFTEIQQIRRLGFSNRLWEIVTGSKEAFCSSVDCCQMGGPQQQWQNQQQMQNMPPAQQQPASPAQAPRPGQMGDSANNRHQVQPPPQQPQSPQRTQQPPQPPTIHAQPTLTINGTTPAFNNTASANYPSGTFSGQESVMVRSMAEEEGGEHKKEKKHKKEKSTREKKEKSGTKEKKEKKSKKDKHEDD